MTELDEIVLVAKMAWALRGAVDLGSSTSVDLPMRAYFYRSYVGVDLNDYRPDLAARLDRKAWASEQHRRALVQTKVLA
jgi:hypothetical protein